MTNENEEGTTLQLDFQKLKKIAGIEADVLPCVVQHAETGQVLILAYVNEEALAYSLEHRVATFWSTSRNELWIKGATSGDSLQLEEVLVNCEQNSLVYKVTPLGKGACHTKDENDEPRATCYYRHINFDTGELEFI
jgi:phosphoribosyl-AMP cyclohydrolase